MADVQYVTLYLAGSPVTAVAGSVLHTAYLNLGATSAPPPTGTNVIDVYPQYITATELAAALAAKGLDKLIISAERPENPPVGTVHIDNVP